MGMRRALFTACLLMLTVSWSLAQVEQLPKSDKPPAKSQAPPRTEDQDRGTAESSSKDSQLDISPPKDDAKEHPDSISMDDDGSDVKEMRPWDPHRAAKNIEVGDFYFKRKNYRAAIDRYQEALDYKPNDAEANFHLAQCYEKLNQPEDATKHYEEYLRIMPQGPLAPQVRAALDGLKKAKEKDVSVVKTQPK
jgi:tetratricopeptide (TPR) repeat protein